MQDLFPSPDEISSDKHKRYWANNNIMVRGQLVVSHKWMLFLPSHSPVESAKVISQTMSRYYCVLTSAFILQNDADVVWKASAADISKPNNEAKVFYFKSGPNKKVGVIIDSH
jgi:hypothetical protein